MLLLERLCALVPRPRKHLVTYHGVLAPAAGLRSRVVPDAPSTETDTRGRAALQSRYRGRMLHGDRWVARYRCLYFLSPDPGEMARYSRNSGSTPVTLPAASNTRPVR